MRVIFVVVCIACCGPSLKHLDKLITSCSAQFIACLVGDAFDICSRNDFILLSTRCEVKRRCSHVLSKILLIQSEGRLQVKGRPKLYLTNLYLKYFLVKINHQHYLLATPIMDSFVIIQKSSHDNFSSLFFGCLKNKLPAVSVFCVCLDQRVRLKAAEV